MKGFCGIFSRKEKASSEFAYDHEKEKPIIRASICTGEKVAGFKGKKTGMFREVALIRSKSDLERFMKSYGLDNIDTEY